MKVLDASFDPQAFNARLRAATTRLLMLDYDGTLAPFHTDPARAVPYPGIPALLDAIMSDASTRLVIVSGRWTRDLAPLLGTRRLPELWGSHGWERLGPDGDGGDAPAVPARTIDALATVYHWREAVAELGGRAERKPAGIAFHWRGLPTERRAAMRTLIDARWAELAAGHGLCWHDFDGGVELRAEGRNKGDVVRELTRSMAPDTVSAYLGDDLTDEDAFQAMPEHGAGILVRAELRPTAACAWLRPPAELREFLEEWQAARAA